MPTNLKLMAIRHPDDRQSLGILYGNEVLDVRAASSALQLPAPESMEQLLLESRSHELETLLKCAQTSPLRSQFFKKEEELEHGQLFTHPGKIIGIGLNYKAHAAETKAVPPSVPILFSKYSNALAGHKCVITLPPGSVSYKFDYETELLIVIGKRAFNVSEAQALSHVAGYCTAQDFSARDLQTELPGGQWLAGKTLDNFAPIGPYFVSADLVGDPSNLQIKTWVNGELRQSSNTGDMIFSPAQIIAYVSRLWPLEPGDLIFTGTPQGVILGLPPDKRVWLKPGDIIVSSVEKLGELHIRLA